ncbi:hypothetical protein K9L16_03895 [Candidatus Pacearchaeota archaeon]|nr:hypothetical protein [Candidatus Pacearchaeota archaeon]
MSGDLECAKDYVFEELSRQLMIGNFNLGFFERTISELKSSGEGALEDTVYETIEDFVVEKHAREIGRIVSSLHEYKNLRNIMECLGIQDDSVYKIYSLFEDLKQRAEPALDLIGDGR